MTRLLLGIANWIKKNYQIVAFHDWKKYICNRILGCVFFVYFWRGAGVVTEQIANLSTRKCRLGSSPSLSAFALLSLGDGGQFKYFKASDPEKVLALVTKGNLKKYALRVDDNKEGNYVRGVVRLRFLRKLSSDKLRSVPYYMGQRIKLLFEVVQSFTTTGCTTLMTWQVSLGYRACFVSRRPSRPRREN